ncbi:aminotransferase [Paenibacillus sp. MBLB4367]|uniref:aminotransferase n=1 Tax=Paenibacillus sp. MBLB4367 TaxID=3384767 RepID=UPI0039081F9B
MAPKQQPQTNAHPPQAYVQQQQQPYYGGDNLFGYPQPQQFDVRPQGNGGFFGGNTSGGTFGNGFAGGFQGGPSGGGFPSNSPALFSPHAMVPGSSSAPGALADVAEAASGSGFNMNQIKGLLDRVGGIDGIVGTIGKVQKVFQGIQQVSPMLKLLVGGLGGLGGKAATAKADDESGLPRRRRRKRRRTSSSGGKRRKGSGRSGKSTPLRR